MEKPNITPTPWRISASEVRGPESIFICDPYNGMDYGRGDQLLPIDEREANAQAIVTAVNCTYGANINPEKIQETLERIQKIYEYAVTMDRNPVKLTFEIMKECEEALNNIKYKD